MIIPTEPIGSIPRPPELIAARDAAARDAPVEGMALATAIHGECP
jgi:hypothetical protein